MCFVLPPPFCEGGIASSSSSGEAELARERHDLDVATREVESLGKQVDVWVKDVLADHGYWAWLTRVTLEREARERDAWANAAAMQVENIDGDEFISVEGAGDEVDVDLAEALEVHGGPAVSDPYGEDGDAVEDEWDGPHDW
jgi:hypothetical protein